MSVLAFLALAAAIGTWIWLRYAASEMVDEDNDPEVHAYPPQRTESGKALDRRNFEDAEL